MIGLIETKNLKLFGEVFLAMKDKSGETLFEAHQKNLIVNNGFFIVANLLAGNFSNYSMTKFGFGDGTTTPSVSDNDMGGTNKKIKGIDTVNTTTFGADKARIYWNIIYDDDIADQDMGGTNPWPVGTPFTIKEFGIFAENEDLFNRIVWAGPDLVMDDGIRLEGYFQITVS